MDSGEKTAVHGAIIGGMVVLSALVGRGPGTGGERAPLSLECALKKTNDDHGLLRRFSRNPKQRSWGNRLDAGVSPSTGGRTSVLLRWARVIWPRKRDQGGWCWTLAMPPWDLILPVWWPYGGHVYTHMGILQKKGLSNGRGKMFENLETI